MQFLKLFFFLYAEINVFIYREMQEAGRKRPLKAAFVAFCLMIHLSISHLISQFINFKGCILNGSSGPGMQKYSSST